MLSRDSLSLLLLVGVAACTLSIAADAASIPADPLLAIQRTLGRLTHGVVGSGRQAPSWTDLLTVFYNSVVVPLATNLGTGLTNAITATFASKRLQLIPYDGPSGLLS